MKALKIITILIVVLIIAYIALILIEKIRFENNLEIKPLIVIGPIEVDIEAGGMDIIEKTKGLGYTFQYEYIRQGNILNSSETNEVENDSKITNEGKGILSSGQLQLFNDSIVIAFVQVDSDDTFSENVKEEFKAKIVNVGEGSLLVEVIETTQGFYEGTEVSVSVEKTDYFSEGQKVKIIFNGIVFESYPPQITASIIESIE